MMNRCPVCNRPVIQNKKGRPAMYCRAPEGKRRSACKDFADRLTMLQQTIIDGEIKFGKAAAGRMRAEIWALANDVKPFVDTASRKRLGDALRNGRKAAGMTQVQLGRAAGIEGTDKRVGETVGRIERAETPTSKATRKALLRAVAA